MTNVAEIVINWLKDGRDYKKTFFLLVYDMTNEEQQLAVKVFRLMEASMLVDRYYKVENSFTAYSRADKSKLAEVVDKFNYQNYNEYVSFAKDT